MIASSPIVASTTDATPLESLRSGQTSLRSFSAPSDELHAAGSVSISGVRLNCLTRASSGLHPMLHLLQDAWSKHVAARVATAVCESRASSSSAPVDLGASVLYTEEELAAGVLFLVRQWRDGTQAASRAPHEEPSAVLAAVGAPSFDLRTAARGAPCGEDGLLLGPLHVAYGGVEQLRSTWKALHPAGQAAYHLGVHDCLLAPARVSRDPPCRPKLWPGPPFWPAAALQDKSAKASARTRASSDAASAAADDTVSLTPWGAPAVPPSLVDAALTALRAGVLVVGTEPAPKAVTAAAQSLNLQPGASYAVLLAEALAARELVKGGAAARGGGLSPLEQLCMQGCPAAARKHMWWVVLQCPPTPEAQKWMSVLQAAAAAGSCPLAPLFAGDAEATGDDEAFFPFEGGLADMAAALCYDASIAQRCSTQPHYWLSDPQQDGQSLSLLPPSGVLPFEQLSSLAAPLTLICPDSTTEMYFLWQRMVRRVSLRCVLASIVGILICSQYCKYWCRLSALDGSTGSLLPLMKAAEHLVSTHAPGLCSALGSMGAPVALLVQPLLRFGCVGYVPAPQVLLLWDRMIAGDDTSVLAVAAAGLVLLHGAGMIAQLKKVTPTAPAGAGVVSVAALEAARDVMTSNTEWIAIIPICQAVLFARDASGK